MRISDKRIKQLQILLHDKFGLEFTAEQTQDVGLNIMRFVITKKQRQRQYDKNKSPSS